MSLTIYHNPHCSKSRDTLKLLQESGVEHAIVEYLSEPPVAGRILQLAALLGVRSPNCCDGARASSQLRRIYQILTTTVRWRPGSRAIQRCCSAQSSLMTTETGPWSVVHRRMF